MRADEFEVDTLKLWLSLSDSLLKQLWFCLVLGGEDFKLPQVGSVEKGAESW